MEWQSLFVVGWISRVRTAIMAQEMYPYWLCALSCAKLGFSFCKQYSDCLPGESFALKPHIVPLPGKCF
jgi:hypothetical protein